MDVDFEVLASGLVSWLVGFSGRFNSNLICQLIEMKFIVHKVF